METGGICFSPWDAVAWGNELLTCEQKQTDSYHGLLRGCYLADSTQQECTSLERDHSAVGD